MSGLFDRLKLFPFMDRGLITSSLDANSISSGYYEVPRFQELSNSPFEIGWGGLVSFNSGSYSTIQLAAEISSGKLKFRQRWNTDWSDWKSVSFT